MGTVPSKHNTQSVGKYAFSLTILAMHEAKTAKISNFWTFWPVIHLIDHHTLLDFWKMVCYLNYKPIFVLFFASCIASILKNCLCFSFCLGSAFAHQTIFLHSSFDNFFTSIHSTGMSSSMQFILIQNTYLDIFCPNRFQGRWQGFRLFNKLLKW